VDHHGLSGSDVGIDSSGGSCSDGESGVGIISGSSTSSGSSRLASSFPSSTFPLSSGGPSSTRGARSNSVLTILAILTMLALSVSSMCVLARSNFLVRPRSSLNALGNVVQRSIATSNGSVLTPADLKWQPPVSHSAYDIKEEKFVDEFGVKATLYQHKKSGASYNELRFTPLLTNVSVFRCRAYVC
jgi:hypothetical protein